MTYNDRWMKNIDLLHLALATKLHDTSSYLIGEIYSWLYMTEYKFAKLKKRKFACSEASLVNTQCQAASTQSRWFEVKIGWVFQKLKESGHRLICVKQNCLDVFMRFWSRPCPSDASISSIVQPCNPPLVRLIFDPSLQFFCYRITFENALCEGEGFNRLGEWSAWM